jgi:L-ascorbate metabolism protein UlaG (beta-lactamase superfamily)
VGDDQPDVSGETEEGAAAGCDFSFARAAHAIRFLGVKHVVPMHYATFPVLVGRPEGLKQESKDIAGLEIHALKPGESL